MRIRKLFALAGSPNQHEAALALEKAHALLLRYNLRVEAVTSGPDRDTVEVTDVWIPGFGGYLWRSTLLGVLGYHMFCHPLRPRDQVVLVGRPTNIEATRALFAWLAPQLERLCLEEFEPMRGQSRSPLCPRRKACKGVELQWGWVAWSFPRCRRHWSEWDRRLRPRSPISLRTFKVAFMAGGSSVSSTACPCSATRKRSSHLECGASCVPPTEKMTTTSRVGSSSGSVPNVNRVWTAPLSSPVGGERTR